MVDCFHKHNFEDVLKNAHQPLSESFCSLDLSGFDWQFVMCGFYLWVYLLTNVYKKTTTWIQIEQIDKEILRAAIWIFENDFEIACENGKNFKSKSSALKYKNGTL